MPVWRRVIRALRLPGWFRKRAILLTIRRVAPRADRGLDRLRLRRLKRHAAASSDERQPPHFAANTSYHAGMAHAVLEWGSAHHLSERYGCDFAGGVIRAEFGDFFGVDESGLPRFADLEKRTKTLLLPSSEGREDELTAVIRDGNWSRADYTLIRSPGRPDPDVAESFDFLRRLYESAREADPVPLFTDVGPEAVSIAVHIRRGDVEFFSAGERRMLPVDYFLEVCKVVEALLSPGRARFLLFSQGSREELAPFEELGNVDWFVSRDKTLSLQTDEDADIRESPTVAFHQLANADILIGSPSYFSYLAGGISDGLVVVPSGLKRTLKVRLPAGGNFLELDGEPRQSESLIKAALADRGWLDLPPA